MNNNGQAHVIGTRDVCLETSVRTRLILKNVRHLVEIHLNLILIGKVDDEGCYNTFNEVNGSSRKVLLLWLEVRNFLVCT